jgi:hypothetical protein
VDTFEAATLKAITTFCEQHPEEVAAYPIGLFPAVFAHDAEWNYRTNYFGHLVGNFAEEILKAIIRYMNAQYRFQSLTQKSMDEMVNLAQDFHRDLTLKEDQIYSLGQEIAGRDTTIGHLEVQILEGDAQILQRNTVIDFLQEQVHDLNQELGDALGHIEMLQEQQMPPLVPNELEEEEDSEGEPKEIEGVSEIDSEHGDPEQWQNRLNYSGSSALVIAMQTILTQHTSNGTTHWSVGSPPDATTVQQDRSRFTSHKGEFTIT